MRDILRKKLGDWNATQIRLTLDDSPRGIRKKREYLVWAFDLPEQYKKDEDLVEKIEEIEYEHKMQELGKRGLYRPDIQGWGNEREANMKLFKKRKNTQSADITEEKFQQIITLVKD